PKVNSLSIHNHHLSNDGGIVLADFLHKNKTLTSLKLYGRPFTNTTGLGGYLRDIRLSICKLTAKDLSHISKGKDETFMKNFR
ncbi:13022_t:CDS:2, partial [Dentiscutata heterogama]